MHARPCFRAFIVRQVSKAPVIRDAVLAFHKGWVSSRFIEHLIRHEEAKGLEDLDTPEDYEKFKIINCRLMYVIDSSFLQSYIL